MTYELLGYLHISGNRLQYCD